jgi:hypothetical protein
LELAVNGQTGGIQPLEFQGAVAFLLDRRHEPSQFLIRERLSQSPAGEVSGSRAANSAQSGATSGSAGRS